MSEPVTQENPRTIQRAWWLWACGFSTLCLGAGFAVTAGWTGNKYVRKLAPNWEYTVGNWWSGMLLLAFAALLAVRACDPNRPPPSRRALWVLSWLGLGLCLDELGSLHERASDLVPLPGQWSLVPFALLFVLAMGWSLTVLWQADSACRRFCMGMLIGFACLGSAEPYDMIEHAIGVPGWYKPVGVVIEEGLELLGGTLLVAAVLRLHSASSESLPSRADPGLVLSRGLPIVGLILLAAVFPLVLVRQLLLNAEALGLHTRGDFGAAPAVMLFALTGAAFAFQTRRRPDRITLRPLIPAAISVLVSIELGCNLSSWITRESVGTPLSAWWAQLLAAVTGYVLLRYATRPVTPATGSFPAGAA